MSSAADVAQRLRSRILRRLHLGEIQPGDRLPSTRLVARRLQEDHRTVAEAYRLLATTGLVEVRARSGVYVARQERFGEEGTILRDTTRWMRDVMVEGWLRHVRLPELCDLVQRCLGSRQLTCLCVESVADPAFAIGRALTRDFGLHLDQALIPPPPLREGGSSVCAPTFLLENARAADFLVTTAFNAAPLWTLLEQSSLDRPLVVVRVHSDWPAILQEAMRDRGLTVVYRDPRVIDRFHLLLEPREGDRLHFTAVSEREEWCDRADGSALYLTEAARSDAETGDLEILRPASPLFSTETARAVVEVMIRLNLRDRCR